MRSLTFYTNSIIATVAAVSIPCLPTSAADSAGSDAGRAIVATHMHPLPGAGGNHGDNWRAMVQAKPGATFHDLPAIPTRSSYGTPLMAPQSRCPLESRAIRATSCANICRTMTWPYSPRSARAFPRRRAAVWLRASSPGTPACTDEAVGCRTCRASGPSGSAALADPSRRGKVLKK